MESRLKWYNGNLCAPVLGPQVPKLDDRISLWQVLRKNEALANISEGISTYLSYLTFFFVPNHFF